MKVMEIVNVIDESSDFGSEKFGEEIPKEIPPPKPREVQEIIEQEPASSSTLDTPSVVKDSADLSTSPNSETHEEKGLSSRIKVNHPPEVIVGNMNELILRKGTIDKSQVEPTKVEEALPDESWVEAMHNELLQF